MHANRTLKMISRISALYKTCFVAAARAVGFRDVRAVVNGVPGLDGTISEEGHPIES